jgi:glutamate formiminotransferase/formiminotetrahydrofolate cyclodeaminase
MEKQLIECVPNFSEGRDMSLIKQITDEIESVEGVKLLDVDPGKATNRTVVTFVGEPQQVIDAAFLAIKKAGQILDMSKHTGEHPRQGATDVCPLIPIANISMEETAKWAHKLGERIGKELDIPIYMYEAAATKPERKNLATIRAGEYEALPEKLKKPEFHPDYGQAVFNKKAGVTVVGARDFLIAYNINLNTTSTRRANSVAFDVREQGRVKRKGNPITGEIVKDANGNPERMPGACKAVKGIGWYIEEYGIAQVSMNLTDIKETPLHIAFEEANKSATNRGMRVTGSEIVGLVPLKVMLDAGKYFLKKQHRSTGIPDEEIIKIAVKSMGLDDLAPFDPYKKIIEYVMRDGDEAPLVNLKLNDFADLTASESPAPGGGSVSAYVGALGAALGGMVANLSSHKRGWDDKWDGFSEWAEKAKSIQQRLIHLVDEDTKAFNAIMEAFKLPKGTEEEKKERKSAIKEATRFAIQTPYETMKVAMESFPMLKEMVEKGNPNSISDGGVGALCTRAAVHGAWMNVKINCVGFEDKVFIEPILKEAAEMALEADNFELEIRRIVDAAL